MTEIPDYEIYKDDETGLYVAEHPNLPVSSCGDTKQEALANAQEAVRLYDEPEGEATPDFDVDRVTDAEDVQEMMEGDESENQQVRTLIADAIGDTQYCPLCGSELENVADKDKRGDCRCSDCGDDYKQYTLSYLKRVIEPESRGELIEQTEQNGLDVLKSDTVEADEDIDIYRPEVNLRMERLSHESVYVAGYNRGDTSNIDRRYWFTVEDGKLEIGREIIRKND